MPPPKHNSEEYYEHEFAIRKLADGYSVLVEQVEKNADGLREAREEILVLKTQRALFGALSGILGGGVVATVVKLLTH